MTSPSHLSALFSIVFLSMIVDELRQFKIKVDSRLYFQASNLERAHNLDYPRTSHAARSKTF